ncbi:MAG: nucleotidyl transferase AbiEii/AbiGii toxin family protein [Gemmatimonadaceae bacterium]
MNTIAELSSTDRRDLFTETAARQGIGSATVIEKDYRVCWTLSRLFSSAQHRWPDMVFKGRTSLSKAYNAIRRFSEDIDLSLGRGAFGFMDDAAFMSLGTNKRDAATNELLARGAALVCGPPADALETDFTTGLRDVQGSWALRRPDGADRNRAQTLTFEYPRSLEAGSYGPDAYIRPAVLLEFGVRADTWPAEWRPVVPYAAEAFPDLFPTARATVSALSIVRTFWEKATILHAEHYRDAAKALPERLSRHYYDLAVLAAGPFGDRALADADLRAAVVEHKALFFSSGWARYDLAVPGTFQLLPSEGHARSLERDYHRTREMLFDDAPLWADIIGALRTVEHQINRVE